MVIGAGTRILAVLLLCLQGSRTSSALRLGVYHSIKKHTGPGWHDLKAIAEALNHTGHQVGISYQTCTSPGIMCAKTLRTPAA